MLYGNHTRTNWINCDAPFYESEMVPIIGSVLLCIEHRKIGTCAFYNIEDLKLAHFNILA